MCSFSQFEENFYSKEKMILNLEKKDFTTYRAINPKTMDYIDIINPYCLNPPGNDYVIHEIFDEENFYKHKKSREEQISRLRHEWKQYLYTKYHHVGPEIINECISYVTLETNYNHRKIAVTICGKYIAFEIKTGTQSGVRYLIMNTIYDIDDVHKYQFDEVL